MEKKKVSFTHLGIALLLINLSLLAGVEPSGGLSPLGSTGCSNRSVLGRCWRYCSGSSGDWCYTKSGCKENPEACADESRCGNLDCASESPGCVKQCKESSQKRSPPLPSGSTGCSHRWPHTDGHGYCWRYCSGNSGDWCYTSNSAECSGTEEMCASKLSCNRYDYCEGAAKGCVTQCRNCGTSSSAISIPQGLDEDCEASSSSSRDGDLSSKSIYRTGPSNREYLFFRRAFMLIDQYCGLQLEAAFEAEIDRRLPNGFLTWNNIPNLNVTRLGFPSYFEAISNTWSYVLGTLPQVDRPVGMSRAEYQNLGNMASDVVNVRNRQLNNGNPQCRENHLRVLQRWQNLADAFDFQLNNGMV